jgi:hypothetical protein
MVPGRVVSLRIVSADRPHTHTDARAADVNLSVCLSANPHTNYDRRGETNPLKGTRFRVRAAYMLKCGWDVVSNLIWVNRIQWHNPDMKTGLTVQAITTIRTRVQGDALHVKPWAKLPTLKLRRAWASPGLQCSLP